MRQADEGGAERPGGGKAELADVRCIRRGEGIVERAAASEGADIRRAGQADGEQPARFERFDASG